MLAETLTATGAVAAGGFLYAKSRRARLYGDFTSRVAQITRASAPDLAAIATRSLPSFADRLAVVPDFCRFQSSRHSPARRSFWRHPSAASCRPTSRAERWPTRP